MARVSRVLPHLSEAEVKEKMRTARNFRQQQKWWIVDNALVAPRTAAEIAKHTGTNVRDVHQVISKYKRQGITAIETSGAGGRRTQYLSVEEETSFLADLEPKAKRGQITTKAEVKVAFEKRVGQQVAKSTIYRLLNRDQWRKLKPRPRHPKSDPEEQAVFKNTFAQQIQQLEQQRDPNDKRPLLVMASGQGRFSRIGGVHPCWCPPGFRPTIAVQHVRQYIYAYAAVAPDDGKMTCLILPYVNTNMMSLFLKQVSADFADYFIVLQVDRAAWHRAKNLQVPENIRL